MTPLARILARRIAATGPITLADYMAECLMHPEHGYYTTRHPFGRDGDFITAPEISQMFGELIGLCLAQAWLDAGAPAPFTLAELGPGRGTLMADLLRATRGVPGFHAAARISLVETSPQLRDRQRAALAGYETAWFDRTSDLPPGGPLYLVANEFFDALPIRQFQRAEAGWRELTVGLDGQTLSLGWGPPAPLAALEHRLADTTPGEIVETCAPATAIAAEIGRRIADTGGLALVVDYGGWISRGDTFQALKAHEPADPLAEPGLADLTAHVDFAELARAAAPAAHNFATQGEFLARLGIGLRAETLARGMTGEALANHQAATRRLTGATEMGSLFKVLALYRNGDPPPPGF